MRRVGGGDLAGGASGRSSGIRSWVLTIWARDLVRNSTNSPSLTRKSRGGGWRRGAQGLQAGHELVVAGPLLRDGSLNLHPGHTIGKLSAESHVSPSVRNGADPPLSIGGDSRQSAAP